MPWEVGERKCSRKASLGTDVAYKISSKEDTTMAEEQKLGLLTHRYEVNRLKSIINTREEIAAFKRYIVPMLKVVIDSGIKISAINPGWCTYIHLDDKQLLPEGVYAKLAELSGSSPEFEVSDFGA